MISVIVPSLGRVDHVRRLCESLLRQELREDYEVLVVCNPPSPEIQKLILNYPYRFRYLENEKRGANIARNQGVERSHGRYLFFFDDDCELVNPNFLAESVKILDEHPEISACGGGYKPLHPPMTPAAAAYYFLQSKWLLESERENGFHHSLIGGNMALRRELFLENGFFNEKMVFGGTETEFFRRLPQKNFLYLPNHFVLHDYSISVLELLRKAFMQGLGSAYITETLGHRPEKKRIYGRQSLVKALGLLDLPTWILSAYRWCFEAGDNYYQKSKGTKPSGKRVWWEVLKFILFKKKLSQRFWNRRLRLVENYRRHLYEVR